jgi:5'-nucleotidase
MKILVVNDDGIDAPGIRELTSLAGSLGTVAVVAPLKVQSGASHRVSLKWPLAVEQRFDVPGAALAYAVEGSPADCTSLALGYLLPEPPDLVLSGINAGFNVGFDVAYSGTIAAAMEAAMRGVPAVAFSQTKIARDYSLVRRYFSEMMGELASRNAKTDGIWSVNIPGCDLASVRGVLYDRATARADLRPIAGIVQADLPQPQEASQEAAGNEGAGADANAEASACSRPRANATRPRRFGVQPIIGPVDVEGNARDTSTDIGAVCANYISVSWVQSQM